MAAWFALHPLSGGLGDPQRERRLALKIIDDDRLAATEHLEEPRRLLQGDPSPDHLFPR